ncbi:MAG: hypothetical protein ABJI96_13845 [Paracoccaceae bacterium]
MFKRLICAAVVFGAAATAPPAFAQSQQCMSRSELIEVLKTQYKENLSGGGLQNEQHLLEVWSSEQTGSFTVFITRTDGISCVMATGSNWNSTAQHVKKGVSS